MYLLALFLLDEDVLGLDVAVEVALLVELLEAVDDLGQHFGGLVEGEHLPGELGLVVDEVAPVAVLQHQVDVLFVLLGLVELDDVGRVHALHALDLPVQVLPQVGLVLDHPHLDQLQGELLAVVVLDQVHISVGALPQPPLVPILVQKHQIDIMHHHLN